jgi:SAM-dependent methyltransferase
MEPKNRLISLTEKISSSPPPTAPSSTSQSSLSVMHNMMMRLLEAFLLCHLVRASSPLSSNSRNCLSSTPCIITYPIAFQTRCGASDWQQFRLNLSGGFGGGGSSGVKKKMGGKDSQNSSSGKRMNPRDAKRANEQLVERYGGDVKRGTQERILSSLESLDPHLREAAQLYKAITQFDALVAPMTANDRTRLIPTIQSQMVDDDREKMKSIMEEHNISERELHNIYQRITWDASADAKAIQADIVGNVMKPELQERITKACEIAVQATRSEIALGKVLDVGCGHGAIVRSLVDAGLSEPDMYMGIDLSQSMVNNAVTRYGSARNSRTGKGRHFVAGDFLTHDFVAGGICVFDSVIFCSALHDLPDMEASIGKAAYLLRPNGGKLIIVHAQGAEHVLEQHRANPVMVKRGLPTSKEWAHMLEKHTEWCLCLESCPADAKSAQDKNEGYLAVLTKVSQ